MTAKLAFKVYLDGPTDRFQLVLMRTGDNGASDGYRIAGPKFTGTASLVLSRDLDEDDAVEIRRYLDAVFPKEAGR